MDKKGADFEVAELKADELEELRNMEQKLEKTRKKTRIALVAYEAENDK